MRFLIGIDEAGRGPLAGPVSVGAVMVPYDFDFSLVKGVRDSKKLTAFARAYWYARMYDLARGGQLRFAVAFSSARSIDTNGIVPSIRAALARNLIKINADADQCAVRLDGNLKASAHFKDQTTIIRGDDLEPVISMASIMAKVRRDRLMMELSARYPEYRFHQHKGYGTAFHRSAIKEKGFCDIHRTTFCTRLFGVEPAPEVALALQTDEISI